MSDIKRKGIILAGGSGTRLHPLTSVVSKQLLPVYDKPMIYYPLATLMQANIKEILIISTPYDLPRYEDLLGDGSNFGIKLYYEVQERPDGLAQAFIIAEDFLQGSEVALILGDNIFYGQDIMKTLNNAYYSKNACIFGYHVSNPRDYGVVEFDDSFNVISIEEKPINPKSNYAIPGLYFFDSRVVDIAKKVKPSERGELEITDVINHYLNEGKLNVKIMNRGTAWLDTGTITDLLSAAQFIETIEKRQGLKINCPEEIGYRNDWLSEHDLKKIAEPLMKSGYGSYLLSLIN